MVFGDSSTANATLAPKPRERFRGWRAAWQTEQTDTEPFVLRGRTRRFGSPRPKVDMSLTDRDIWVVHMLPERLSSGLVWHLPVRRLPFEREHGDRAIGNAALVLRALLAVERRLGLRDEEQLFIALALRDLEGGKPVLIERQAPAVINVADWRRETTADAGRKMHLEGRSLKP